MPLVIGQNLPDANFCRIVDGDVGQVALRSLSAGKKLVLFGLPGAFTRTCSTQHLPGFVGAAGDFREKGVNHVVCVSVNDPWVIQAWDAATGAGKAGVDLLADADSAFTIAMGLQFSAPAVGFINRCKRFSLFADDGVIRAVNLETERGVCDLTTAQTLLAQIQA